MDKREGQPRQSSLPTSLHPHIVTRPHPRTPQQGSSSSGRVLHEETRDDDGILDDSPYQLRPFAPSLSPATFDDGGRRTSRPYVRRETVLPEPGDTFDEDGGRRMFRASIPLPRRATNRRAPGASSIPHGLPPIRTVFNSPFPSYAYTLPNFNYPFPAFPERTLPPPWQEGEAGPSSLARSRRDQSRHSGHSEPDNLIQTEILARERTESSPLGFRAFEWEGGQPDRYSRLDAAPQRAHVSDRLEDVSREYVRRGGTVSAQLASDRSHLGHSRQYDDYNAQRHHSLPPEFVPGQHTDLIPTSAEDELSAAAPYRGLSSGEEDDLPPPYTHSIANSSIFVKKELEDDRASLIERPGQHADSVDTGDLEANLKKRPRKKAVVACQFCQKRKLRCSTERPKCSNCGQRGLVCVYGQPKRRGPGKAPRGSRSKKTPGAAQESSADVPLPFASADFHPSIAAYTYPYPPHLRSELMGPVLALAPLDTVSSRSAGTPPHTPSTGQAGSPAPRGATRKRQRSSPSSLG